VAESSYLRYPNIARDLITFTAEDDVWLASARHRQSLRQLARSGSADTTGRMWIEVPALLAWFWVATGVGSALGPGLTCFPA